MKSVCADAFEEVEPVRNRAMHVCAVCGRTLEVGEACNCDQPIRGAPRDGLRAKCPLFRCRSWYRQKSYIVGGCGKHCFGSGDQRNEYYRRYCCELWRRCGLYEKRNGERLK